jgi:hypothetical protein
VLDVGAARLDSERLGLSERHPDWGPDAADLHYVVGPVGLELTAYGKNVRASYDPRHAAV